eukprot:gene1691-16168_t
MNGDYGGSFEQKIMAENGLKRKLDEKGHKASGHSKKPGKSDSKDGSGMAPKKIKIDGQQGKSPSKNAVDGAVKVKKERSHDGSKLNSTPKSALNTPSALNSVHTPPKVKQEPVSPAKSRKEVTKPSKHVPNVKSEEDDDDDIQQLQRISKKSSSSGSKSEKKVEMKKPKKEEDDSDEEPLSERIQKAKKAKTPTSNKKPKIKEEKSSSAKKRKLPDDDDDDDFKQKGKAKKEAGSKDRKSKGKGRDDVKPSPTKGKKKPKEEEEVWKWWEEEPHPEGIKWITLEHNGPYFPPLYDRLPSNVKFYYDGKHVVLSDETEEVAGFYARMIEHEYSSKDIFNNNFMEDWRKVMTDDERKLIKDLKKCKFREIFDYYQQKSEERKAMSKAEKQVLKDENQQIADKYGMCIMDGHKQKVGNFRIEPPGLFRGRGDHPKQGKLKRRVQAEDIIINIGKDAVVPSPPEGHKWKSIQHDNKVTWLACWVENIAGNYKYVMLNSATKLKGEKDWQKYETARKLKSCVEKIRANYQEDWKSKEMRIRQRGVALYFIDKLALRAGHEKEEGESADTVGCCSLRVEHIKLHKEVDDQENVVEFDFLGKDSIRYQNNVPVEKRVFKNLALFMEGKSGDDELFDRLTTTSLNKYLGELMEGLTAKVFRTFNASKTLQDQLGELTVDGENVTGKLLAYNRANRAVAILCNHQRAPPKTFDKQMENLMNKIKDKKTAIKDVRKELKELKNSGKGSRDEKNIEKKDNQMKRLKEQLFKLEVSMTDKEENKEIALGTSKLNYLDPRISVAWCKKNDVPIEKIYNKTQRQKFQWAIDMTEEDFVF